MADKQIAKSQKGWESEFEHNIDLNTHLSPKCWMYDVKCF